MATTSIWSVKGWLGKVVIYIENSTNYQISGRELLTPDEVRMLDNRYLNNRA